MTDALWVFGYGSLMWDTGFAVAEQQIARLTGWRRSFCMWSVTYRGTPENPGLVLALDQASDAACEGIAFRVPAGAEEETRAYLQARELITYAYREETLPVTLRDGRQVQALTYVINQDHSQYCARLALEDQARIIANRQGQRGPNSDYLWNTVAHLADLGIRDAELDWLAARVRDLAS